MNKTFNQLKIGILGGGQLGKMLLQKAADYDLDVSVLDPNENAPARFLCKNFVKGDFKDFDTVYAFGQICDLITIEIENVNADALLKLEKEGKIIYPQPQIIKLIQDKGEQKLFYQKHGIPTADFILIDSLNDWQLKSFPLPAFQKLRIGGYDGRGVKKIKQLADLTDGFTSPSVIEKAVPFTKEISVIVARKRAGEIETFPAVEMEFNSDANLVEFLFTPASINEELEVKAKELAVKIAHCLEIVGVLAVEMFVTQTGELFVNEMAPRPHNSGHQTIEANRTSQYEQHLRCLLDLPLGNTDLISPAVMINLLGEKNYEGPVHFQNIEKAFSLSNCHVHLYGKKNTHPFRKMGHLTILNNSLDTAKENAKTLLEKIKVISK